MKRAWTPQARDDFLHIRAFVGADDPRAAVRLVGAILAATRRLAETTHIGRPGRIAGTRELVIPRTPYIVPYRLRGGRVEILRVLHGARKWPDRL